MWRHRSCAIVAKPMHWSAWTQIQWEENHYICRLTKGGLWWRPSLSRCDRFIMQISIHRQRGRHKSPFNMVCLNRKAAVQPTPFSKETCFFGDKHRILLSKQRREGVALYVKGGMTLVLLSLDRRAGMSFKCCFLEGCRQSRPTYVRATANGCLIRRE